MKILNIKQSSFGQSALNSLSATFILSLAALLLIFMLYIAFVKTAV